MTEELLTSVSLETILRVDELCDEFEADLATEGGASIEQFLQRLPDAAAARQVGLSELLAVECRHRQFAGESFSVARYRDRFADYPDVVQRVVSTMSQAAGADSVLARASEAVPATVSDRYEIVERIGQGTFAEVFLAKDKQLARLVALKKPQSWLLAEPQTLEMFLQEAQQAASLRHPGVVTIFDIHIERGCPWIVQEYVEGGTLRQWMSAQDRPVLSAVKAMRQIALAVGHAHDQGVLHRDLKPANVLVAADGCMRVADFGLAVRLDQPQCDVFEYAGTRPYMSPEQHRGETHALDNRTDIWSLGVIHHELLTGRRPDPPLEQARTSHVGVPRELMRICDRCLQTCPDDRYPSTAELVADLDVWLERTMSRARARMVTRAVTLTLAACLLLVAAMYGRRYVAQRQAEVRASGLVSALLQAREANVLAAAAAVQDEITLARTQLTHVAAREAVGPDEKDRRLRAQIALTMSGTTTYVPQLRDRLLGARPEMLGVLLEVLRPQHETLQEPLWRLLQVLCRRPAVGTGTRPVRVAVWIPSSRFSSA